MKTIDKIHNKLKIVGLLVLVTWMNVWVITLAFYLDLLGLGIIVLMLFNIFILYDKLKSIKTK